MADILLSCEHVCKTYAKETWFSKKEPKTVLTDINFSMEYGRSLGIAGVNGAGKSTLSKIILGIEKPSSGSVYFQGVNLAELRKKRDFRQNMQAVFQNPASALNPCWPALKILTEPLQNFFSLTAKEYAEKAEHLMELVELNPKDLHKNCMQFSGGQQQRLAIARALALNPQLLILDEALSSLDMSTQAKLIELLHHLKDKHRISLLVISHDIRVTFNLCDDILVLNQGRISDRLHKEQGLPEKTSPFLQKLLASAKCV